MALAGVLELQMVADVARLRQDMDRMQGVVSRAARQMESALDNVRGAMAGMFSGASVLGFGMWVKSAIDFSDQLNDLNRTTSLSIERLSGLALMSKQTGSDLTGMAQAMNKLTMEMGKAPDKFAKIGITAKDPLEAFKQLSDLFVSIEDPQLRAAVAAEALGKGWAGAAPALAEGSAKIEEMVKRGEDLAGITAADAAAADEFNDRVSELQIALTGLATGVARDLLPLLTALVEGLTDTADGAKGSDDAFNLLTESLRAVIVLGGNVAFVLRGIGTEIGGIAAQAGALLRGDFGQASAIRQEMISDAKARRAEFDAWEQRMMTAGRAPALSGEEDREFRRMQEAAKLNRQGVSVAGLRGFVGGDGGKAAAAAAKKAREEQLKRDLEALEEEAKVIAEINELLNEQQKQRARQITEGDKMVEAIEFETKALGMTNLEREKAIALRDMERLGIDKTSEAYEQLRQRIEAAV
ncbi:MAG TPA: hypothetical protein VGD76_04635, partial [Ramlibacter sp.]